MRILLSLSLALTGLLMLSTVGHSETVLNKKTEVEYAHHDVVSIDSLTACTFDVSFESTDVYRFCVLSENVEIPKPNMPNMPNDGTIEPGIYIAERNYKYPLLFTDAYKLYRQPNVSNQFRIRNKSNI